MKILISIILLCAGSFSVLQAQMHLSLEECKRLALETSEDMRIASYQFGQAKAEKEAAYTAYFPELSGSGGFAHLFKDIEMMGGTMSTSMKAAYLAGISLQQPIYAGGKIVTGNKMATKGVEIAQENRRLQELNTVADASQAYWIYISVGEKIKLLEHYNRLLDSLYQHIQNYVEVEMATKADLLRIESRRSNTRYQTEKALNGLELARMSLCRVIGVDYDTPIIATDTINTNERLYMPSFDYDISFRPEYRILEKQSELKKLEIKSVQGNYLPMIGFSAEYVYVGGIKTSGMSMDMGMPYISAGVSIPLNYFGEGMKKVKSARLAHKISQEELNKNRRLLDLEVQQALRDLQDATVLIRTAGIGLADALETLEVNQTNYYHQMATLIDLLDAQTQWQEARNNQIEARIEYKLKEIEYLRVTGKINP